MSCPDGVGGRGGIKHEASQRRERLWRQSSPSGINARKSVATVTKNRSVQLIVMRQSHRRPSLPHLTVKTVPAMITAAKNAHVTKNVPSLASATASPSVVNAAITVQISTWSTRALRTPSTLSTTETVTVPG